MRVLVAGATGFIGGALCAELVAAGHEVVVLSRDAASARARLPMVAGAFAWPSPTAAAPPPDAFDGVDGVVNLAGEPVSGRWTDGKKRRIHDSRALGTRHLVQAMGGFARRPRVLVNGSAVGYYGNRGDEELTEASPPGEDFLAGVCRDWEAEARRAEELGMRVVRSRTGLVLGSDGGMLRPMLPLFRFGLGGPLGDGNQWWPWVHRRDVVGMVRLALEDDRIAGPLNATAPNPVRQGVFAKTMGRVLGRPALVPVPAFALRLVLGEFSAEVLNSKRVLPRAASRAGYRFHFADLETALRDALRKPARVTSSAAPP
ncbi:MAG: TIGR01777 family protein [SAR202 cluster bacterium]|nr:TIGR01777 family protein [SAR202 cluster bacterium]